MVNNNNKKVVLTNGNPIMNWLFCGLIMFTPGGGGIAVLLPLMLACLLTPVEAVLDDEVDVFIALFGFKVEVCCFCEFCGEI